VGLWGFGKKAINSTIGTEDFKPLDSFIGEISESLIIPTNFTKAVIASGSFTIPKDGTYKIIACGAGGASRIGGGGCAIDQRDYMEGDILTLTVSGVASAVCSSRSLSMTANATTTVTGATASGGNVGNYTGGNCTATKTDRDSLGCGAGGYGTSSLEGGDGGIIGGDGYIYTGTTSSGGGAGGNGGIIGGNGGDVTNSSSTGIGGIGGSGMFGGFGGSSVTGDGGDGGTGTYVGGVGGHSTHNDGGDGGDSGIIGGNGGDGNGGIGGKGGNAGLLKGLSACSTAGGEGGFNGMYWAIPFKEVADWTKGNAIIFIEEV